MNISQSEKLFTEAIELMPGGVNSPVRAFGSVGGTPRFMVRGEGAHLFDVDGNRYIDYVMSWGPLVLGHAHPKVVAALQEAVANGTSFGTPNPHEITLARLIQQFMPNLEMMRFVNSGTEATMSVLRLARAFTGRDKIIKFAGNYHGHADMLLVAAGSGVATLGLPNSPGVPASTVQNTLTANYNDLDSVQQVFEANRGKIAGIILEPVAGNMGLVLPQPGFLAGLRDMATAHGALLVFDEVMTGFRVHKGGAQTLYGIKPDLTALGKVIGGGLPVGAYGGRRDIMEMVAPVGAMYQAGTLSGNPLAMVAGIETLRGIKDDGVWEQMAKLGKRLDEGVAEVMGNAGISIYQTRVGTMQGLFFTKEPVTDYASAKKSDTQQFAKFFHGMLKNGVYLAPSQFEAGFLSTVHTEADIEETLLAVSNAFSY